MNNNNNENREAGIEVSALIALSAGNRCLNVHAVWSEALHAELRQRSAHREEGQCENGEILVEYHGTTDDGNDWVVVLTDARQTTKEIEVVFVNEHHGWDTQVIEVPKAIADSQSLDAFHTWTYSPDGEKFRNSWPDNTAAVYVWSWYSSE